jgi:hypothetical protein
MIMHVIANYSARDGAEAMLIRLLNAARSRQSRGEPSDTAVLPPVRPAVR